MKEDMFNVGLEKNANIWVGRKELKLSEGALVRVSSWAVITCCCRY